jgi:uncharacterized small protein (DUF1192 family)
MPESGKPTHHPRMDLVKIAKLSERERSHPAVSGAAHCAECMALRSELSEAVPELLREIERLKTEAQAVRNALNLTDDGTSTAAHAEAILLGMANGRGEIARLKAEAARLAPKPPRFTCGDICDACSCCKGCGYCRCPETPPHPDDAPAPHALPSDALAGVP